MGAVHVNTLLAKKGTALALSACLCSGAACVGAVDVSIAYADGQQGQENTAAQENAGVQEESKYDQVAATIRELSVDPTSYSTADESRLAGIQSDIEELSAEEQARLDEDNSYPGNDQPLGRILESAQWAVWSYGTDDSTTLPDSTYTTKSDPVVSSESNKGKSTSSRIRNWWVESVVVSDGKAKANIYVTNGAATKEKLSSYPSVWIGGQTISRNPDNTFTIPVDLNGVTYFGGISSSMPTPIMYELSTAIDEASEPEPAIDRAKRLIAALPADPDVVVTEDKDWTSEIEEAQAAYDALTPEERDELDQTECQKSQSYGRWIESAAWGLLALQPYDNSTDLVDGDYSDVVWSESSRGKMHSDRDRWWQITKLVVENGKATANIGCFTKLDEKGNPSTTSRQIKSTFTKLRIGGVDYPVTENSKGFREFVVPIAIGQTSTFTATITADAIAYQMSNAVPEVLASDDRVKSAADHANKVIARGVSAFTDATGPAIMAAAQNLKAASQKQGVTQAEIAAATKLLDDALAVAELKPANSPTTKPSKGESTGKKKDGKTSGGSEGGSSGQQGGQSSGLPTPTTTVTASRPAYATAQASKTTSASNSGKKTGTASKSNSGKAKSSDSGSETAETVAQSTNEASAYGLSVIEDVAKANRLSGIIVFAAMAGLLLVGMCVRVFQFVRNRG